MIEYFFAIGKYADAKERYHIMAYVAHGAGRQRACVFGGVMALHVAAIWALLSGLAVTYIPEVVAIFEAHNTPAIAPPPPQPTVRPPRTLVPPTTTITRPNPISDPPPRLTERVSLPPLTGDVTLPPIELPTPGAAPSSPPTLTMAPKLARPLGDPGRWVSTADYPTAEIRADHEGVARFRLLIGTYGRVSRCEIVASTGFPGLDAATCAIVSRRARFAPARDDSGAAATGSYSGSIAGSFRPIDLGLARGRGRGILSRTVPQPAVTVRERAS
jgi:protein TonB